VGVGRGFYHPEGDASIILKGHPAYSDQRSGQFAQRAPCGPSAGAIRNPPGILKNLGRTVKGFLPFATLIPSLWYGANAGAADSPETITVTPEDVMPHLAFPDPVGFVAGGVASSVSQTINGTKPPENVNYKGFNDPRRYFDAMGPRLYDAKAFLNWKKNNPERSVTLDEYLRDQYEALNRVWDRHFETVKPLPFLPSIYVPKWFR
jgi:hypothetical protein